ncbi:MAG: hypothetical protein COB98_00175 [Flavobacteriaceae bacterium]|nr:MAG: hypothetical protein COB98_00175 [Flavobacteriaceae bacterium]
MQTSIVKTTENFFKSALNEEKLTPERKILLSTIAKTAVDALKKDQPVNFNFICTHNSRRSQLCQVWAHYATHYFKLENIQNFSGGTAVTAFFRNTVKTLQNVGFNFHLMEFSHANPKYIISNDHHKETLLAFSKLYDDESNSSPFIAITTCNNADENCPFITEATHRFHLPFIDPKSHDDTDLQEEKYMETNRRIAGELHFLFLTISKLI